jgi:uncharacterized protein YdhG (YjbR/CyaY superfamily)
MELVAVPVHDRIDVRDVIFAALDHPRPSIDNGVMSIDEITAYLEALDEPKRSTLQKLRAAILEVIPEAEQGLSYQLPAFRLRGKVIVGFAAFKEHLSYLPHSGSVFPELEEDLVAYSKSIGALRFPIDEPLPNELVEKLIKVRMSQAFRE